MDNTNKNGFNIIMLILNIIVTSICALFVIWILANKAVNTTGAIGAVIFGIVAPILSWQYYFEHKPTYINSKTQQNEGIGLTGLKNTDKPIDIDFNYDNKDFVEYTDKYFSPSTSDINEQYLDIIKRAQELFHQEMYQDVITLCNSAIELNPNVALAYILRGASNYAIIIKRGSGDAETWNSIVEDYKKALEIAPENVDIATTISTLFINILHVADCNSDLMVQHDILFKNFPDISVLVYIMGEYNIDRPADETERLIEHITTVINKITTGGFYLYTIRAIYYSQLDAVKYSEQIQKDLEEAFCKEPNSLFNNFARCYFVMNLIQNITGDNNYSFDGNNLPLINARLISNVKNDIIEISNCKYEKLRTFEILNKLLLPLANNYATEVLNNSSLFFIFEDIVKDSNMDIETFISVCKSGNFSSKYKDFDKNIQTILKCKEYAKIAYSLDEKNSLACFALGFTKLFFNEREEALKLIGKSIELDPKPEIYKLRAMIYQKLEQYDNAIKDLDNALPLCEEDSDKNEIFELMAKIEEMKNKQKNISAIANTERKGRELDI